MGVITAAQWIAYWDRECVLSYVGTLQFSFDSAAENEPSILSKKMGDSVTSAAQHLRKALLWPHKRKKSAKDMPVPVPLRQRFSDNPSLASTNKRTLSVRTNISNQSSRKKLRLGLLQAMPHLDPPRHTPSRSSISSILSVAKPEDIPIGHDTFASATPPSNIETFENNPPSLRTRRASVRRRYFCFGYSILLARKPTSRKNHYQIYNGAIPPVA